MADSKIAEEHVVTQEEEEEIKETDEVKIPLRMYKCEDIIRPELAELISDKHPLLPVLVIIGETASRSERLEKVGFVRRLEDGVNVSLILATSTPLGAEVARMFSEDVETVIPQPTLIGGRWHLILRFFESREPGAPLLDLSKFCDEPPKVEEKKGGKKKRRKRRKKKKAQTKV